MQCSAFLIFLVLCITQTKWVYAIQSLCCSTGAVSSATHLCCNYSLWMKSFLRLWVVVQVTAMPRTTRKSLSTSPLFPVVSHQEGGNNLPETTPNHQTSMSCTCHAKNQASKLKCLHILLSVLILEQGDQKNFNLLIPWGLLKKAMRDKTLYFFCSSLQY